MEISNEAVEAIRRDLKGFGYTVDFEYTRQAVDELMAGNRESRGAPKLFIEKMLRDKNLLPS